MKWPGQCQSMSCHDFSTATFVSVGQVFDWFSLILFFRFLMPHPIIHPHSDPEPHQKPPKIADCLSCRLWGGVVHVGIAGFVASHIKEMQSRGAKGFLIAFSSGKKKPFYTPYASSKGKFHRFSVSHHSPHILKQVNFN